VEIREQVAPARKRRTRHISALHSQRNFPTDDVGAEPFSIWLAIIALADDVPVVPVIA